jgi:hypothetical protein
MNVEMNYYECWVCGVPFGMSAERARKFGENGETFFCIKGCKLSFGEGSVKRLERQLSEAKAQAAREAANLKHNLDREKRLRADAEKEAKRFKCPHCPRKYLSANKLLIHEREAHKAPLRLVKDAGPNALNTDVGST